MTPNEKANLVSRLAAGESAVALAVSAVISVATLNRWVSAFKSGGIAALDDARPTGRPQSIALSPESALDLRRRYVVSNLNKHSGSMTYAARSAARDPESPLSDDERAAILADRASKHLLPVSVRRACRGDTGDAAVVMKRSPRNRDLSGAYTPGLLRMVREPDGSLRRLRPGERQSWDDASINFCVCVPWPWGGDKCSDRYGVRVGRFQLLAGIDDATDFFVGWGYVIRMKDSYRSADVVSTVAHAWRNGYKPEEAMFEGGAWQALRTLEFLRLAGVELQDAKGRPHNKLIEGAWNRLWTPLSQLTGGQIGRYRGEMERENLQLSSCQSGAHDPRKYFPTVETALAAIQRGIAYVNAEVVESKDYGKWIPQEMHAEGLAANHRPALDVATEHLTLRERMERTVTRGMIQATALSPLGEEMPYRFCSEKLAAFEGAPIWVAFDPFQAPVPAHVSLRERWRDYAAGHVIDASCACVSAAPMVMCDAAAGRWRIEFADGMAASQRAKKLASAVVRRELRSLTADGQRLLGESTLSAPEGVDRAMMLGSATDPVAPPDREAAAAAAADVDLDELERQAGILAAS